MSDFLATALGLAFTLVVCLFAVRALLSPWLRLRHTPASAASRQDEQPLSHAVQPHVPTPGTTPVHTT
jgi:hypothetical protein